MWTMSILTIDLPSIIFDRGFVAAARLHLEPFLNPSVFVVIAAS